jgi:MFS family permease
MLKDHAKNTTVLVSPPFVAMALANFFAMTSFACFFLFPVFIIEHGGTRADIGILMGAFSLSSVLCRPYVSEMIDRAGRKKCFTAGSLIMSLLPLVYLTLDGALTSFYLPLLFMRIIHGIGLALCITAAFTYAADIIPAERLNEGIGIFGISGLTGMAVGPVIAELVLSLLDFQAFFFTSSAIAALALLIHLPLQESYSAMQSNTAASNSFFSVFKQNKIVVIALLAFLFGFGIAASNNFVTPFANESRLTFVSVYFIAYSLAAVLTRLVGGRLADRFGEGRILPYALTLTGSGLLLLTLVRESILLILSGWMTGCGHGFLFPCLNALAIRGEETKNRGKITGAFTGSIDMGIFIGSIALGYIGELAGFRALFLVAGSSLLVALGVLKLRANGRQIM